MNKQQIRVTFKKKLIKYSKINACTFNVLNWLSSVKILKNFKKLYCNWAYGLDKHNNIALYYPLFYEVSSIPIAKWLHNKHRKNICLPKMLTNNTLIFTSWDTKSKLINVKYGIKESNNNKEITPTLLIVPLVAFNKQGYRLGHGKGFYDCTVAKLKLNNPHLYLVGLAYSWQQCINLPTDSWDIKMDAIITEKQLIVY